MKKKAIMCLMAALCLGSGMTAYAAPETMPDGTIFDAEFYAQVYPDVVAVFGTNADAMYQHYVQYGKNEGRFAYAGAVQLPVNETDLTTQTEEQSKIIGIQGIPGGTYQLSTWGMAEAYDNSGVTDQMITMTVRSIVPEPDQVQNDLGILAPYTTDGYEWKPVFYVISGEFSEHARWWASFYDSCDVENSKDWNYPEGDVAYGNKFTVTWNGVDYTECKIATSFSTGQYGEVGIDHGFWLLLPKGYDGKIYLTVKGTMLDEYGTTANDDAAVTFLY